jgi:serine/threonine protein kinase
MDHPHLIKHNAVWSLPGYIVINMELAEATLLDLMLVYQNELGQQLEPAMLGLYMWQVADALDYLNARKHLLDGRKVGFQHGDVKPSNILLLGDVAKLTDHGLATPTHGSRTPCPEQGTPAYAAPEAFIGYYSEQSDQYSLAVTYFVLRTGLLPFPPPPNDPSISYLRPMADMSPLSEAERPALLRALSAVPQSRFPSCKDFMTAVLKSLKLKAVRDEDKGIWKIVKDDKPDPPRPGSSPSISLAPSPSGVYRRRDVT